MYGSLAGPQGRSGRVRKFSPPPGFDPRTVQTVASRYTDCAVSAHRHPSKCFSNTFRQFIMIIIPVIAIICYPQFLSNTVITFIARLPRPLLFQFVTLGSIQKTDMVREL
jgi:hypothetical protein